MDRTIARPPLGLTPLARVSWPSLWLWQGQQPGGLLAIRLNIVLILLRG